MSILSTILQKNTYPRYKTSAELRAIIGQPIDPCDRCGCAIRSVLHTGDLTCEECDPRADPRAIAFRVVVVVVAGGDGAGTGTAMAAELTEVQARHASFLPSLPTPAEVQAVATEPFAGPPEIGGGMWTYRPDHAGRLALERIDCNVPVGRWWRRCAFEALPGADAYPKFATPRNSNSTPLDAATRK